VGRRLVGLRDNDDEGVRALLEIGTGLSAIDASDIADLALEWCVGSHWVALTLTELYWRSHGWHSTIELFNFHFAVVCSHFSHSNLTSSGSSLKISTNHRALKHLCEKW
jgi:hypothetical protein